MNEVVTKPIDIGELALTMNSVLGEEVHVPMEGQQVPRPPNESDNQPQRHDHNDGEVDPDVAAFVKQLEDLADSME